MKLKLATVHVTHAWQEEATARRLLARDLAPPPDSATIMKAIPIVRSAAMTHAELVVAVTADHLPPIVTFEAPGIRQLATVPTMERQRQSALNPRW